MEDGGGRGWIEQTGDWHPKKKEKRRGVCLTHSARSRAVLAGRFLILGAQLSLMQYAGAEKRKEVEESYEQICSPSGPTAPSGWKHISAGPVSWLIATEIRSRSLSLPARTLVVAATTSSPTTKARSSTRTTTALTTPTSGVGDYFFDACFSQLEPKPPSGGADKNNEGL
jgi:hypothetical protein